MCFIFTFLLRGYWGHSPFHLSSALKITSVEIFQSPLQWCSLWVRRQIEENTNWELIVCCWLHKTHHHMLSAPFLIMSSKKDYLPLHSLHSSQNKGCRAHAQFSVCLCNFRCNGSANLDGIRSKANREEEEPFRSMLVITSLLPVSLLYCVNFFSSGDGLRLSVLLRVHRGISPLA